MQLLLWIEAHPALALLYIELFCSYVTGLVPQRYASNPLVRIIGHIGHMKHPDASGTLKVPGMSARDPGPT